jgi:pyruvate formate-lyase/glycerol dehydratase family glycyl radical enzyme
MVVTTRDSTFGSTPRTQRLKSKRVYPGVMDEAVEFTAWDRTPGQLDYLKELKTHIRTYSKICPERARYYTRAYRESEGEPEIVRVAKGIASILDNMTVYIEDDELIVGNYANSPVAMPVYPEYYCKWLEGSIGPEGMLRERVNEEERRELLEMIDYWKDRCLGDRIRNLAGPELDGYTEFNGAFVTCEIYESDPGVTSGFKSLLTHGANGIVRMCKDRLEEIRKQGVIGKTPKEYMDQIANLEGMIIANEAFARFGKRYAQHALELANKETDPQRKKELEHIAEVCNRVPAEPARTLHEALQSFFLFHMLQAVVTSRAYGCCVRFDTLFYPYYKKDIEEGRLTREQALELIECLYIKIEGVSSIRPVETEALSVGSTQFQTFTLGGILENGEDAVNDMSYLALEASMNIHTIQPTHVIRYHPNIDPVFIDKAIDCIRTGIGFPAFINDTQAYYMFLRRGVPENEVWDWVCPSCISRSMPNANMRQGNVSMGYFSYGKALDLALNDGYDIFSGRQLGAHTGDPTSFKSIEDVKDAYLKQIRFLMDKLIQLHMIGEETRCQYMKKPLVSPYIDGCIEKALSTTDFAAFGNYHSPEIQTIGAINVADSLAVLKRLVFEEKKVAMAELVEALHTNWQGKEELRQMCLNVPKYGNDDDEADAMAQWVHWATREELCKYKDYWGAEVWSQGAITSGYYSFGRGCPATPDGRFNSEPFADGTCSPMAGRDSNGPTATLSSVGKLNPMRANEMLLNQKFMPQFLEGENKTLFAQYLKTWYDLGCYHVQFNVVDKDVLLDAQVHPEKYPDLVVRVAGYSAYWADLGKSLQDDIILRTEQNFC